MLRLAIGAGLVLVVLAVVIVAVGYALPKAHVAEGHARIEAPPDRVFALLQDVERYPSWRSGLTKVEVLARAPALRWREDGGNDAITFEMVESTPTSRLVSRIADPSLPFGGTWTYALSDAGGATLVTITERGEVYNPVFRFVSRFVMGHTATIDRVLADLSKHFATARPTAS